MDADVDRKPVPVLSVAADFCGAVLPVPEKKQKMTSPFDDPLFAALHRMRIQDEVDNRMRNEEIDEELERLRSYEED